MQQARHTRFASLLSVEIDRLRAELHRAYQHYGSVNDHLLDISRRLDRVIILYERTVQLEDASSDVQSVSG